MKIKEVTAAVKRVKNYNSYQVGFSAEIGESESPEKVGEELMERALKIVCEKLGENLNDSLEEVGAAWPHKKSPNFLSAQFSKGGPYEDVKISDLEEIDEGYKQETPNGTLFYKVNKERRNNKMPLFRIYKIEVKNE